MLGWRRVGLGWRSLVAAAENSDPAPDLLFFCRSSQLLGRLILQSGDLRCMAASY